MSHPAQKSHLLDAKRRFIKDPVWGHIEIFAWEREVLNDELVNRLNGVVQNSCAFKVYPSLKYSRYAHSIGAIHVVTQMYVNLVRNTLGDERTENEATKQLKKEIEWVNGQLQRMNGASEYLPEVKALVAGSFPIKKEYALPLVVLRFCAMLHDIGHLPYSHLFEHALGAFLLESDSNGATKLALTTDAAQEARDLRAELKTQLENAQLEIGGKPKIHELLGFRLTQMLAKNPLQGVPDEQDDARRANEGFLERAIFTARDIWVGVAKVPDARGETTQILSSLVSGVIDADRIDFVRRDSLFSGLFECSVDFGRLFDLYEVAEVNGNDGEQTKFLALPSRRSTSDAEKLLIERFQLYKYVVAHHRVHRFDELLERCLLILLNSGKLNRLLTPLVELMTPGENKPTLAQLLYLDDSFLDHEVKDWHAKLKKGESHDSAVFQAFVDQPEKLSSAFQWDDDFRQWWCGPAEEKTGVFSGWYESLIKTKVTGPDNSAGRKRKFRDRAVAKFNLEIIFKLPMFRNEFETDLMKECGMLSVVIGVTGGKVKDGIGNEDIAHALGIKPVFGYLHALQLQTMLFNIWFRPKATADNHVEWNSGRAKLLARLFKLVQDRILDPVADKILDQCQAEMLSTSADPSASPAKPDQALEGGDK